MIQFDITQVSVVMVCDCGWRDVATSRDAARRGAKAHESSAHPGVTQIRDAERVRLARRAQQAANVRPRVHDEGHGEA